MFSSQFLCPVSRFPAMTAAVPVSRSAVAAVNKGRYTQMKAWAILHFGCESSGDIYELKIDECKQFSVNLARFQKYHNRFISIISMSKVINIDPSETKQNITLQGNWKAQWSRISNWWSKSWLIFIFQYCLMLLANSTLYFFVVRVSIISIVNTVELYSDGFGP